MLQSDRIATFSCRRVLLTHNKSMQSNKANLSRLLLAQESRQLAFAAELGRYTASLTSLVVLRVWSGDSRWA